MNEQTIQIVSTWTIQPASKPGDLAKVLPGVVTRKPRPVAPRPARPCGYCGALFVARAGRGWCGRACYERATGR